jgi:hypothetical protein
LKSIVRKTFQKKAQSEKLRNQFPLVNDLINNVKKVFIKAPLRVQIYRETLTDVPLPPKPVITRWGTWLEAALFYFKYSNQIKEVMSKFNNDSSVAIKEANKILNNPKLSQHLSYINNYKLIIDTILKFEKQGVPLTESIELIEHLKLTVNGIQGTIAQSISKKLGEVINKNDGLTTLTLISKALCGEFSDELKINPQILSCYKYAPITSVDVERSFSMYKNTLNDNRQSFKIDNLEKHLIVCVNENVFNSLS